MLAIINKNFDEIIKYTGIAIIFAIWASFTCMFWINLDDYESDPLGSLVVAILGPAIILFLGFAFCWIVSFRVETRMNAMGKIGTDESWDFFETLEMLQMFSE